MLVVQDTSLGIILSFVTLLFWGIWGATFKYSSTTYKVQFELFFVDWSLTTCITSLILGWLFGTDALIDGGSDTQQFWDNLLSASGEDVALCAICGCLAVFGNYLLLASTELSGLSSAFPLAISITIVCGTLINYTIAPQGNTVLIAVGVFFAVMANISGALSTHYKYVNSVAGYPSSFEEVEFINLQDKNFNYLENQQAGYAKSKQRKTKVMSFGLGLLFAICAGIFFSIWPSVAQVASRQELTYYSILFIMTSFGALFVIVVAILHLIGLPSLTCSKINWKMYYEPSVWPWHALAIIGGILWATGTWANMIASESVGFTVSYFLAQASVLVTSALGVVIWREYNDTNAKAKLFLFMFFIFYIIAVLFISFANTS